MKYGFLLVLLLNFNNLSIGQNSDFFMCSTVMDDGGGETENAPCVEYFDYFYDYLDHVQVHKPVFHFVNYDYNVEGVYEDDIAFSIPALQFTCIDDSTDPLYDSDNNAFKMAKDLIYWANRTSSMLETSEPGGGVLPNNDFKVRYTDVVDCNDIIIVANGGNIQNISGRLNFHITNKDNESFGTMGQIGKEQMILKNIGNKIIHPDKSFSASRYGGIINHEMGHDFGLCHAQSSGNLCMDIPNNEVCASGEVDPSCGMASISCDSGGMKNNTMISGTAKQRGITPCQFVEASWHD